MDLLIKFSLRHWKIAILDLYYIPYQTTWQKGESGFQRQT